MAKWSMPVVLRFLAATLVSTANLACSGPQEAAPRSSTTATADKTTPEPPIVAKGNLHNDDLAPPKPEIVVIPGKGAGANPAMNGVDTFAMISGDHAKAIAGDGFAFAVRYVRHSNSTEKHITPEEAQGILGAGLSLMLVQEGRGWKETRPTAGLGKLDGETGVAHARELGYPASANLWLDIETVIHPSTAADVIAYAEAWHTAVKGNFVPGYYVGPDGKLDAAQLGALPFEHFWKSGAKVPTPAGRGYQLVQHSPRPVGGVEVDVNITQADEQGRGVFWMAP